jgi:hypothetical protein
MTDPLRILVTGSRHCTLEQAEQIVVAVLNTVVNALADDDQDVIIVHGKCPQGGVDMVAHLWATENAATPEPHPADWDRHGVAAGPIRNTEMAALGARLCLAFPARKSPGTWDCIRKAVAAGIPAQIYPLEKPQ